MVISDVRATQPPAETALIPDEALRHHVGNVEATDVDSIAVLREHIQAASTRIARILGQPLGAHSVEETFYLSGSRRCLHLSRHLNADVTGVAADGVAVAVGSYFVRDAMLFLINASFQEEAVVTYNTGWPVTAGAIAVPPDLAYVAKVMAAVQWFGREQNPQLRMAQLSGVFAAGYDPQGVLPANAFEILNSYRRVEV